MPGEAKIHRRKNFDDGHGKASGMARRKRQIRLHVCVVQIGSLSCRARRGIVVESVLSHTVLCFADRVVDGLLVVLIKRHTGADGQLHNVFPVKNVSASDGFTVLHPQFQIFQL